MINHFNLRNILFKKTEHTISILLIKIGITANILTILGFLLAMLAGTFIVFNYLVLGGVFLLISSMFDMLDGAIARASKTTSQFGAFLDSTLDRISEFLIFSSILIYYLINDSNNIIPIILCITSIGTSFLVSYTRARAESLQIKCTVGIFTRAERIIVLFLGIILSPIIIFDTIIISLAIITALSFVTMLQRIIYTQKHLK
tara:strand:+ start:9090 stop:9695 length:606 start_codon:yes stop_codon:yes gene_type:complete